MLSNHYCTESFFDFPKVQLFFSLFSQVRRLHVQLASLEGHQVEPTGNGPIGKQCGPKIIWRSFPQKPVQNHGQPKMILVFPEAVVGSMLFRSQQPAAFAIRLCWLCSHLLSQDWGWHSDRTASHHCVRNDYVLPFPPGPKKTSPSGTSENTYHILIQRLNCRD